MAFVFRTDPATRRWYSRAVFAGALLVVAPTVRAQTMEDDPQIEAGHRLLQANHCDEAATTLRGAWESGRRPRALAELGLAEACLSRWVEAETNLSQALATPDEWVTRNRPTLHDTLELVRGRLGTLIVEVVGPPAEETEVYVDDHVRGRAGQDLRVIAGALVVEVRAPGFENGRRSLQVTAGQRSRERFDLVRGAIVPRTPSADTPSPERGEGLGARRHRRLRNAGSLQTTLGWIGLGAAGLGVGVGIAGYVVRESNVETWNDDALCNSVPGMNRDQECPDEGDAWRMGQTLMWVGFIGGSLLATGSVVLLLTAPSSGEGTESRFALACAPILGGAACSLRMW